MGVPFDNSFQFKDAPVGASTDVVCVCWSDAEAIPTGVGVCPVADMQSRAGPEFWVVEGVGTRLDDIGAAVRKWRWTASHGCTPVGCDAACAAGALGAQSP